MITILKTNYFLLWVIYKRDSRISTAGKYLEIIRNIKGIVVSSELQSLHGGTLKITLTVPLSKALLSTIMSIFKDIITYFVKVLNLKYQSIKYAKFLVKKIFIYAMLVVLFKQD